MRDRILRTAAPWVAVGAVALLLTACTPGGSDGAAGDGGAPSYDWPTAAELGYDDAGTPGSHGTVIAYTPDVVDYTGGLDVVPLQTTETDGDETVVTLSSDILFDPSEATLTAPAQKKIGGLVADVPKNAEVKVYGYTDTVDSTRSNQKLSERRAQAVADAVADARPDLSLDVRGFGETHLAEPETGDPEAVAEARAANRRVELRYED